MTLYQKALMGPPWVVLMQSQAGGPGPESSRRGAGFHLGRTLVMSMGRGQSSGRTEAGEDEKSKDQDKGGTMTAK